MPWCEPCQRFWNPSSATAAGECPACGAAVETPSDADSFARRKVPWHFWAAVAAAAIYLVWRAIQGIAVLL